MAPAPPELREFLDGVELQVGELLTAREAELHKEIAKLQHERSVLVAENLRLSNLLGAPPVDLTGKDTSEGTRQLHGGGDLTCAAKHPTASQPLRALGRMDAGDTAVRESGCCDAHLDEASMCSAVTGPARKKTISTSSITAGKGNTHGGDAALGQPMVLPLTRKQRSVTVDFCWWPGNARSAGAAGVIGGEAEFDDIAVDDEIPADDGGHGSADAPVEPSGAEVAEFCARPAAGRRVRALSSTGGTMLSDDSDTDGDEELRCKALLKKSLARSYSTDSEEIFYYGMPRRELEPVVLRDLFKSAQRAVACGSAATRVRPHAPGGGPAPGAAVDGSDDSPSTTFSI